MTVAVLVASVHHGSLAPSSVMLFERHHRQHSARESHKRCVLETQTWLRWQAGGQWHVINLGTCVRFLVSYYLVRGSMEANG